MDFEENLINQYNQLKSREDIKSGQHTPKRQGKGLYSKIFLCIAWIIDSPELHGCARYLHP